MRQPIHDAVQPMMPTRSRSLPTLNEKHARLKVQQLVPWCSIRRHVCRTTNPVPIQIQRLPTRRRRAIGDISKQDCPTESTIHHIAQIAMTVPKLRVIVRAGQHPQMRLSQLLIGRINARLIPLPLLRNRPLLQPRSQRDDPTMKVREVSARIKPIIPRSRQSPTLLRLRRHCQCQIFQMTLTLRSSR